MWVMQQGENGMAETRSDGLRISYDDTGQGEPALLFLPGWCGSREVFTPLAERCSTGRRTLALDWRGHGQSERTAGNFGVTDLVNDAQAVITASGAERVVPVALAHAGWVAIEMRRRLRELVPKLVLLDWIVLDAPSPFLEALQGLQDPRRWEQTREQLFAMWLHGLDIPALTRYVREDMGSYDFDMWARAGREIRAAYIQAGSPLRALSTLVPPASVLHLYAQPEDPGYLAAQQSFAGEHPWFSVRKLEARSHFPMFELPEAMVEAIEGFVA
jgi:pimeloyl-ACP methyl ester carboxylesterase